MVSILRLGVARIAYCISFLMLAMVLVSACAAAAGAQEVSGQWSGKAQHMIGLTGVKPKEDGLLTSNAMGVSFQGKQQTVVLAPASLIAASSGSERVELWGTKGQILRSIIPDGGGILLAAFAHHRVGMLAIEYRAGDGSHHAGVFLLPESEIHKALESFPQRALPDPPAATEACQSGAMDPQGVQVFEPDWNTSVIPMAYRALLYENLIGRLEKQKNLRHVYRYGQQIAGDGCPRYTIRLAAANFHAGNQVQRVVMGPAGMFVGATKISMNATMRDEVTHQEFNDPIKTSIRGQSECYGVAAQEAKKIAGKFAKMRKGFEK